MLQVIGKKFKNQRGFTLIELLAVIVILGIIAAIAVPSIGNVINDSRQKAEVAEALQIIDATKLLVANNNETNASQTYAKTDLDTYLDHVKDANFTVKVDYNSTSGKYTYSIKGHDADKVLKSDDDGTTYKFEQDLIDWQNSH
ncbi:MAG: type II secretion system protein [Bacillota bacterium]|nr:type II secretion system protein [Bacillota bacterium]